MPPKAKPAPDPLSKEAAEEELRRLAEQARNDSPAQHLFEQVGIYARALALLSLIAVYANASLLALSPVYGQISASAYHGAVVAASLFAGWSSNLMLRRALPRSWRGAAPLLPLAAAYIPAAQYYLFRLSELLGATYGPAVTEALTLAPLLVLGTASVADVLEGASLGGAAAQVPRFLADAGPGLAAYATFRLAELESIKHMVTWAGHSLVQTRMGLELALAAVGASAAPTRLLLLAVPAALHAAFLNTHLPTPYATASLNATLAAQNWSLVDRRDSLTGYISVLDDHASGFRVMRCDHSLLGGEWTKLPRAIVGEPVYSVFAELEAVRLVEVPDRVPDNEAKALNIGLGIGTTPSALIAHGIDTTIVEIDPVVYDFAKRYFALPENHTAVIADAVRWSEANAAAHADSFDYIIHDVFTGGAEPVDLFTEEFLTSLRTMLKPNGVIAINYAGDFTLPPLSIVANTVRAVFPSCRTFRESAAPAAEQVEESGRDFDNVLMFCVKSSTPTPAADGGQDKDKGIVFRQPRESDYLQSLARKHYLFPRHEVPDSALLRPLTRDEDEDEEEREVGVLRKNNVEILAKWHVRSARNHWEVMRKVLPAHIWEMW